MLVGYIDRPGDQLRDGVLCDSHHHYTNGVLCYVQHSIFI